MTKLSENAIKVAEKRYFMEGEDWEGLSRRVSENICKHESPFIREAVSEMIFQRDFLPGGRILRNAGRLAGSLMNCIVLPVGDSREEIGELYKNLLILWGEGSGCGVNFTPIRPKGSPIRRVGGIASGLVSFLKVADSIASTIESGGSRRAAGLALCDIYHPEIEDFIDSKLKDGLISHFNISVGVNKEFINAVKKDTDFNLEYAGTRKTIKARDLWYKILNNMLDKAEPGLLNLDYMKKNNSFYYAPVVGCNPCVTGDMCVYTADGRGNVPIIELSNENKDVPVFCKNDKNKTVIRMMRNPRKTGFHKKILKIEMSDGSILRCTEDHKIKMADNNYIEAKLLSEGDRLFHLVRYKACLEEIFSGSNSRSSDYFWINDGHKSSRAEHRLIVEFAINRSLKPGEIVHHYDFNSINNNPSNLKVMSRKEHTSLHSEKMKGKNNPSVRFPEKNYFKNNSFTGSKNGRFLGILPEEIFNKAVEFSKEIGHTISTPQWKAFCKKNNLSNSNYSLSPYKNISDFTTAAALEANVLNLHGTKLREYIRYLQRCKESDLELKFDYNTCSMKVIKHCEFCGSEFSVSWGKREQTFCSPSCINKGRPINDYSYIGQESVNSRQRVIRDQQLGVYARLRTSLHRDPFKKEWENECKLLGIPFRLRGKKFSKAKNPYIFRSFLEIKEASPDLNFKVISVKEDGYEDVYTGTVDEFHNFYTCVSETTTKTGKEKFNYINNLQCGEQVLENWGACCLGAITLPNFVSGKSTNWKKLEQVIKLSVRFLDDVIDVNRFSLKEIETTALNSRKIGLGYNGLADYLFAKQIRYGSEKCIEEIEKIYRFLRDTAYMASVELAKEKGPFPKFDRFNYLDASFVKKLPSKIRLRIEDNSIRNCCLTTQAPCGTISLVADCSSGIEPIISKAHWRSDRIGKRSYIHPIYKNLIESGEPKPDWFVDSYDLKPEDHLEVQAAAQRLTCSGISKTLNVPKDTKVEDLDRLLLEYIQFIKGVTVYRDGSRSGQILTPMTEEEITSELINSTQSLEECQVQCHSGSCEV